MNAVFFGLSLELISCRLLVFAEVVEIIFISRLTDEALPESSLYHIPQGTLQCLDPERVYVGDTHLSAQPCCSIPQIQIWISGELQSHI